MEVGIVKQVDIDQEMRGAYLDYAMSVITARALPDVRDGLKPVQRRILYAMGEMGVRHNTPYRKCARIVGDVLGRYHPHGDAAVYEALVRMAQDFSMRYVLVDGQGNFGSVDGDPPAAMRYTEARLHAVAEEMLLDIDKETVDLTDNFDSTLKEPTVLPAKLPNLILNGAAGIAVGMATNIPPHNLREIADAICHLIDHPDATMEDLGRIVLGPDFPTGGIIMGLEGIKSAYATGRGRILVRAKAFLEDTKGDRQNIIVTELPYQVNKAALQERIAELVKDGRIDGIGDMRDESDRQGMRIVLELKKGAEGRKILNQLYKYTAMQSTFGVNLLALVDGEPRVLTLKRILQHYIDYRHQVITRRTQFDLARARARAHILEGLKIALDHLDEVIATIRQSPDADTAKLRLMKKFKLDEIQAQAILDMQLRRLARLERDKIEQELKEIRKLIAYLEDLLAHPQKIYGLIKDELRELKEKYGDDRRTRIYEQEAQEFKAEDLIPDEDMVVALTQKGYLKRYRLPRRAAKPTTTRESDPERFSCVANMHDGVLFLTDRGRVCQARCHELPEADRSARGTPIGNLITLEGKESVTALVPLPRDLPADAALALVTRGGKIKRVAASEFSTVRGSGVIAMTLEGDDTLVAGTLVKPGEEAILVTRQGQAIRFSLDEVRNMGRQAGGVSAVRIVGRAEGVAAFGIAQSGTHLLAVTDLGQAKRTPIVEFPAHGRGGGGVVFVKVTPKTGLVAGARVVAAADELTIGTSDGQVWRGPVQSIAEKGRALSLEAVPELKLPKGETVVSVTASCGEGEARSKVDEPLGAPAPSRREGRLRGEPKARGTRPASTETDGAPKRKARNKTEATPTAPEPASALPAEPKGRHRRSAAEPAPAGPPPAPGSAPTTRPEHEPPKTTVRQRRNPTHAPEPAGPTAAEPAEPLTKPTRQARTPAAKAVPPAGTAPRPKAAQAPTRPGAEPAASTPTADSPQGKKAKGGKAAPTSQPPVHAPSLAPWRRTKTAVPEERVEPGRATNEPEAPAAGARRMIPAPPPLPPGTGAPRVSPKAPVAPDKSKPKVAPDAKAKKTAAPATPKAGKTVKQMSLPMGEPAAATRAQVVKRKDSAAQKPTSRAPRRAPSTDLDRKMGNASNPRPAPATPGVTEKPTDEGDILIRFRGGRVGWLPRER